MTALLHILIGVVIGILLMVGSGYIANNYHKEAK